MARTQAAGFSGQFWRKNPPSAVAENRSGDSCPRSNIRRNIDSSQSRQAVPDITFRCDKKMAGTILTRRRRPSILPARRLSFQIAITSFKTKAGQSARCNSTATIRSRFCPGYPVTFALSPSIDPLRKRHTGPGRSEGRSPLECGQTRTLAYSSLPSVVYEPSYVCMGSPPRISPSRSTAIPSPFTSPAVKCAYQRPSILRVNQSSSIFGTPS